MQGEYLKVIIERTDAYDCTGEREITIMNNENEIDKESRAYKFAAGKGVMNLPNKLTIARMVMIPVFILFFYLQFMAHYFVALAVFGVACLTDLF